MQFLSPSAPLLNTFPNLPFFSKHTITLSHHLNPNYQKLGFHFPKTIHTSNTNSASTLQVSQKSIYPTQRQFSDTEEEEDDDEDDDYDEAAEEYEEFVAEASDVDEEEEEEIDTETVGTSSRFEEHKWQRVERFRNEVQEFGDGIIDLDELVSIYDFRIDKFQRLSIEAFLRGSSVVVSAPTSSGKTLIAEAAAVAVATVAKGRRIFYTTPLKALSNQKYREFRETFGESNVGLLTGDSAVNKDAPVLIMTTEILRNMLYQSDQTCILAEEMRSNSNEQSNITDTRSEVTKFEGQIVGESSSSSSNNNLAVVANSISEEEEEKSSEDEKRVKDPRIRARKYQLELCRKAVEENIIVYMGTGYGKTHIAVLLIYELGHLIKKPQKNMCVFLAPTVPLVRQMILKMPRRTSTS